MSILSALGPIFLLVMLGAVLKRFQFPGDGFWPLAERFTYFLLFPALLVYKLATAPFENVEFWSMAFTIVPTLLVVSFILVLVADKMSGSGADFTSVYQGSIRFNSYVGMAAVSQLFGDPGTAIAALTMAVMIPLINLLCIIVFVIKTGAGEGTFQETVKEFVTNPLIIACLSGVALNMSSIGLPFWFESIFYLLSQPALPIGLLAVGAGLKLDELHSGVKPLIISSSIKFFLLPITVLVVGLINGLDGITLQVVVIFFCLPTATSAFILARQLGGNATLMATIITGQTLISMATLPLISKLISGI